MKFYQLRSSSTVLKYAMSFIVFLNTQYLKCFLY
jgi:hypothetical protein